MGIEPTATSLPMKCSTPELPRHFAKHPFISTAKAIFGLQLRNLRLMEPLATPHLRFLRFAPNPAFSLRNQECLAKCQRIFKYRYSPYSCLSSVCLLLGRFEFVMRHCALSRKQLFMRRCVATLREPNKMLFAGQRPMPQ